MYQVLNAGISLVFIGSGAAKLSQVSTFAQKIADYCEVFATDLTTLFRKLAPMRWAIAWTLSCAEVLLGLSLLYGGCYGRCTRAALLVLTSFFMGLTLYTAVYRRMSTCGCLGTYLTLTPWQSFGKSVFIWISLVLLELHHTGHLP
ncbi:MAG: MauE/DoxX family redox-associated membrane protein [Bacteroidota bacterium]